MKHIYKIHEKVRVLSFYNLLIAFILTSCSNENHFNFNYNSNLNKNKNERVFDVNYNDTIVEILDSKESQSYKITRLLNLIELYDKELYNLNDSMKVKSVFVLSSKRNLYSEYEMVIGKPKNNKIFSDKEFISLKVISIQVIEFLLNQDNAVKTKIKENGYIDCITIGKVNEKPHETLSDLVLVDGIIFQKSNSTIKALDSSTNEFRNRFFNFGIDSVQTVFLDSTFKLYFLCGSQLLPSK